MDHAVGLHGLNVEDVTTGLLIGQLFVVVFRIYVGGYVEKWHVSGCEILLLLCL